MDPTAKNYGVELLHYQPAGSLIWSSMISLISHPHGPYRLGDFLIDNLGDSRWSDFRASVAFVKQSGTEYIQSGLADFALKRTVRMSVGIDHGGSSVEGLVQLLDAMAGKDGLWIYKNSSHTFHPKVFLFKNKSEADLIVGSGNLTKGGLFENAELGVRVKLNLTNIDDAQFLTELEENLDRYSQARPGICLPLDSSLIDALKAAGELPTEQEAANAMRAAKKSLKPNATKAPSPFSSEPVPKAPVIKLGKISSSAQPGIAQVGGKYTIAPVAGAAQPVPTTIEAPPAGPVAAAATLAVGEGPTFGMTLQTTDVGVGQTTPGAGKRSPELFIPVGAIDDNPTFWGWITKEYPDTTKYQVDAAWALKPNNANKIAKIPASSHRPRNKLDWKVNVSLRGAAGLVASTFWYNPSRTDLRMRAKVLRGAGSVGDILLMSPAPPGAPYDYDMRVIPKSSSDFNAYLAKLTTKVKNSKKVYGYF